MQLFCCQLLECGPDIMKNKLRCASFLGALLASSEVFFNWACIDLVVNSVSCIGLQAHASAYHRCWSLILETILLPKHSKIILNQGKTKPQYEFAAMGTDLALYLKHFKGAWSLETLNLKTLAECCLLLFLYKYACSSCTYGHAFLVSGEFWKLKGKGLANYLKGIVLFLHTYWSKQDKTGDLLDVFSISCSFYIAHTSKVLSSYF